MKKNIINIILFTLASFSLVSCNSNFTSNFASKLNLKDDYIIKTNDDSSDEPSGEKVEEIFDSDKVQDLMEKLKSKPKEISDKMTDADSDTEKMINDLNSKAEELTDTLNQGDFEGKSEDIKNQLDDISDKLDEINNRVDDSKNQLENKKDPIDKNKITDVTDEFQAHMDNLENAINRIGSSLNK